MLYAAIQWNYLEKPSTPQSDTSHSAFRSHNAAEMHSEVAV